MLDTQTQKRDPDESVEERSEKLIGFISELETEAKRRVELRKTVEERWIEDLRQYHGKYNETTQKRLDDATTSRVFKNRTRKQTNALISRLFDLLFPTDDRNWSAEPTPVPEMDDKADEAERLVQDAGETKEQAERNLRAAEAKGEAGEAEAQALAADMEAIDQTISAAQKYADDLAEVKAEAGRRCRLMVTEIEDQLATCRYPAAARDTIEDGCKMGMGVIKGPVIGDTVKMRWVRGEDGEHVLTTINPDAPGAFWVDPWSFFPSPDMKNVTDSEGFYERHLMTPQQLRKFARIEGVDKDSVRALLREKATEQEPAYLIDLRHLTLQNGQKGTERFIVWEYTGPVDKEKMILLAESFYEDDDTDKIAAIEEMDELAEMHARVMFCQGRLLLFGLHPLDSNAPLYSVFSPEKDEASPFGFGIPYLMRDSQSILNSSQRMMMDNAGYSVGPQIVIRKGMISPADNDYQLKPRKIWLWEEGDFDPRVPPFQVFNIPTNQVELANIIALTEKDIDEETGMPQVAQGENGTEVTKTFQGLALLMNAANVIFRRIVKNFDDDVTIPLIERFYHWNMQFSRKDAIKGDYEVVARGADVLLLREMQSVNLMTMLTLFGEDPELKFYIKRPEMLKALMRSHMMNTAEFLNSDTAAKKAMKEAAQQPDPATAAEMAKVELQQADLDLRRAESENKTAMHQAEWAARERIAHLEYAKAMQISVAQLNAELEKAGMMANDKTKAAAIDAQSREIALAAEIDMAERTGKHAGGSI